MLELSGGLKLTMINMFKKLGNKQRESQQRSRDCEKENKTVEMKNAVTEIRTKMVYITLVTANEKAVNWNTSRRKYLE